MKTLFLAIALFFCTSVAQAAEEQISPKALPPDDSEAQKPKATVNVSVQLPQMDKAQTKITLYPYTTKLPKVMVPYKELPLHPAALRNQLLSTGYTNRLSLKKAYPDFGWRWQYAYHNALRQYGEGTPKGILGIYKFTDGMMPFVAAECKRINKIEAARKERYEKAVSEYEDNHKDEEMEALRMGLEATELKLKPRVKGSQIISFDAQAQIPPGEWWVTGTHKVPGLVYFWEEPLKVEADNNYNVTLTDSNALLIQGGW